MADLEHEQVPDDLPGTDLPESDLAWIADALAGLTELNPAADQPSDAEPMPAWVWVRLQGAMEAERTGAAAGTVSGGAGAEVIDLASRRPGRATRWAGGLVAASVAVIAVGVGVTAFQGNGSEGTMVATEQVAAQLAPAGSAAADARAFGASPAPLADDEAAGALATPKLTFAGMVPPTLRLVGSDTDYTASDLGTQVSNVLTRIGLPPEKAKQEMQVEAPQTVVMPEVAPIGFLSSAQALRDCITKLTKEAESTALMVDMSTYQGQEAGVVVAPDYPDTAADPAPDMSELEVWIVDPECDRPQKMLTLAVAE